MRFNYESADPSRGIETRLDPSLGFFAHKDDHVDFCLVAVAPVDASALTSTLSKAHVSKFPAALAMHDDAKAIDGMPITIWQVREKRRPKFLGVPQLAWSDRTTRVNFRTPTRRDELI